MMNDCFDYLLIMNYCLHDDKKKSWWHISSMMCTLGNKFDFDFDFDLLYCTLSVGAKIVKGPWSCRASASPAILMSRTMVE
jgi:hypothetical protein